MYLLKLPNHAEIDLSNIIKFPTENLTEIRFMSGVQSFFFNSVYIRDGNGILSFIILEFPVALMAFVMVL